MNNIIKKEDLLAYIQSKIYVIRGKKVMLDRDLAELYGVETRTLNQKVKRNVRRFPSDFMFQMTKKDIEEWKSQIVRSEVFDFFVKRSITCPRDLRSFSFLLFPYRNKVKMLESPVSPRKHLTKKNLEVCWENRIFAAKMCHSTNN